MRPRIRTIKPEAFLDEDLWDAEDKTGLPLFRGFSGLWCHADREGRLEWRPRALKAGILPYWEGDFGDILDALEAAGFIEAYTVNGRKYGRIPSFSNHQSINNREEESRLPAPEADASPTRAPRVTHACPTPAQGKGREGKEVEGSDASRDTATTCPPDLDLTKAQKDNLKMAGASDYQISAMVSALRTRLLGDDDKSMKPQQWRNYLSKAVTGTWSDPRQRPPISPPATEADPWD